MAGTDSTAFDRERFDAIYPEGVERHYWNISRNRVIADRMRAAGAEGPMLEVGCGKGLVVAALRRMGFEITGVELADVDVVPEAKERVVVSTDAMTMDASFRSTVRTILLLDVIEHIEDPRAFIAGLRSAYPALRWMVFTVPARQELFSNYDRFNDHFRRYDREMLYAHVSTGGKETVRSGYFFHALYPAARVLLRTAGERKPYFTVPPLGLISWLHKLVAWLLVQESKVLPGSWRGTSLIAVVDQRPGPSHE